jgi:hypothetical protein
MSTSLQTNFNVRPLGRAFAGRLLLLLAIIPAGCAGVPKSRPANVVSLDPQDWEINRSPGMPLHPSASTEGAWSLALPKPASNEYISAVQTPFIATSLPRTVMLTFKIESDLSAI